MKQEVLGRTNRLLSFDTTQTANKTTRPRINLLLRVFVAAGTRFQSRCLATIGGIQIQTHRLMGGIYEVRLSDGFTCQDIHTMFHDDRFRHSKVDKGDTQTHRQHDDLISLPLFFS
jgi:hypothetical protein